MSLGKLSVLAVAGVLLAACSGRPDAPLTSPTGTPVVHALAQLKPASGSAVTGTVQFRRVPEGVEVHARIENLAPGPHGFHIHEHGDCSAADASSAGGHWNPDDAPHGDRLARERHAGDLGNVVADASGKVDITFTDTQLALSGPRSILGLSILVHEQEDDGTSQPSGNAGNRIACGVITARP